jgi:hypothetical protein
MALYWEYGINNTTITTLTMAAILAATLVVGGTFAAAAQTNPGGTLLVKKVVVCDVDGSTDLVSLCPKPENFQIRLTGNNPNPSGLQPASGSGTLYTLGAGPYKVTEEELNGFDVSFSGDCPTGTIAAGDQKTCTITNTEEVK